MNIIKMNADTKLIDIIHDPKNTKTMLTEWLNANKTHDEAKELTYCEFPLKWRWDKKNSGQKDITDQILEDYITLILQKENDSI